MKALPVSSNYVFSVFLQELAKSMLPAILGHRAMPSNKKKLPIG